MGLLIVVAGEGLEPSLCCQNRILNPTRLPIPPPGQVVATLCRLHLLAEGRHASGAERSANTL